MNSLPSISDSEWKVIKLLWQKSPLSAYDVFQALLRTENWHRNTVNTMLKRLEQKGAVRSEKYKNLYLYFPIVSEQECVEMESQSFLQRVFGGAIEPLMLHFAKKRKLSARQIQELTRILEGKDQS